MGCSGDTGRTGLEGTCHGGEGVDLGGDPAVGGAGSGCRLPWAGEGLRHSQAHRPSEGAGNRPCPRRARLSWRPGSVGQQGGLLRAGVQPVHGDHGLSQALLGTHQPTPCLKAPRLGLWFRARSHSCGDLGVTRPLVVTSYMPRPLSGRHWGLVEGPQPRNMPEAAGACPAAT